MTPRFHSTVILLSFSVISATILVAGSAAAQSLRVAVGDLSRPAEARAFDRRLDDAARRFCGERYRPTELSQEAACERAIREEGLAQLSPDQRLALSRVLGAPIELARATR